MSARRTKEGASAPSNILSFPKPKHPRRAGWFESMGEARMRQMLEAGESIPANVSRLFPPPEPPTIGRTPELALILCIYSALGEKGRSSVRDSLGRMAFYDANFAAALELLDGRG